MTPAGHRGTPTAPADGPTRDAAGAVRPRPVALRAPDVVRPSPTSPCPTGREEDWRFTPVDRLAPLLVDDAPTATARRGRPSTPDGAGRGRLDRSATAPRGAVLRPRRPRRRDRVVSASRGARCVTHPGRGRARRAGRGSPSPATGRGRVNAPPRHRGRARTAGHRRARAHAGSAELRARTSRSSSATAPTSPSSPCRSGTTTPSTSAQHDARVGRDATLAHIVVTLGGEVVRVNPNVALRRPGRRRRAARPLLRRRRPAPGAPVFVDHEAPHCRAASTYKGALQGDGAHTVWVGDVLIRASAEGTDTYELNRNLVLTDGARADSVPNLEIETGDIVGAGHAQRHRPVRRRAAVLPAGPRHPRGRGPPPRRARLPRRASSRRSACPSSRSDLMAAIDAELGEPHGSTEDAA